MRNLECVHCGATFGEETELATLRRERDEARANGATSERAAIVAWLKSMIRELEKDSAHSTRIGQPNLGSFRAAKAMAISDAVYCITRLDHHRDREGTK